MKPEAITADLLRTLPLPRHDEDADKDERGRILAVGGSRPVPGALLLSGVAALRAGAGKLQLATIESAALAIGVAVPEALVVGLPETAAGEIDPHRLDALLPRLHRCDAVLVGPGMIEEAAAAGVTDAALAEAGPAFVLDAGALCDLGEQASRTRRHDGRVVLTPHAGEMARLTGLEMSAIEADQAGTAARLADKLNAVVALKGGRTVIAAPGGRLWEYAEGKVGLATSGSGDTLAGVIAGLLARGAAPHEAAIWGVYLHGEAGNRLSHRLGRVGFLARELLDEIPPIMASFDG